MSSRRRTKIIIRIYIRTRRISTSSTWATCATARWSEAVWAIEFDDEDKDQKVRDLVSPLEVARLENLTEQIPSQEELDKLVGKTGQDLFDDGWDYYYYNLDEMEAGLNHGPFAYIVKFAYEGEPMVNSDDFDFYEAFKDLPVTSVTYDGIGDAANMD